MYESENLRKALFLPLITFMVEQDFLLSLGCLKCQNSKNQRYVSKTLKEGYIITLIYLPQSEPEQTMAIITETYLVVLKHREDMGVHIRLVDHHLHGRVRLGGWITSLHKHQTNKLHQLHLFSFIKSNLLESAQVFWYCFSTHLYENYFF